MKTGCWVKDGDNWYYLKSDGTMATGLQHIDDDTYYFYSDGEMATGWQEDNNNIWHYFYGDGNGSMAHDRTLDGYHIDKDGKMITGTGWVESDGSWYYLNDDGEVKTNWQCINDNWYYLYPEGSMAHATTIEGYYLNDDGEWVSDNDGESGNSNESSNVEFDINYDKINSTGTENWQNWKDELSDAVKENTEMLPNNLSEEERENQANQIIEKLTKALQVKYQVIYNTYKLAQGSETYKTLAPLYKLYENGNESYTKTFFKGFFSGFEDGLYFAVGNSGEKIEEPTNKKVEEPISENTEGVSKTGIGKTGEGIPLDEVKPDVLKQIHADDNGAYGYLPNEGTAYDKAEYDFTDVNWSKEMQNIRKDYLESSKQLESDIERMQSEGFSKEDIANHVVDARNQQKVAARESMTAEERAGLEERNIEKYGNPIGPKADSMFNEIKDSYINEGIYESDDQIWDVIIQKSMQKDDVINTLLGLVH